MSEQRTIDRVVWIAVSDRLPPYEHTVLFTVAGAVTKWMRVGHLTRSDKFGNHWHSAETAQNTYFDVTHWAELPGLPT